MKFQTNQDWIVFAITLVLWIADVLGLVLLVWKRKEIYQVTIPQVTIVIEVCFIINHTYMGYLLIYPETLCITYLWSFFILLGILGSGYAIKCFYMLVQFTKNYEFRHFDQYGTTTTTNTHHNSSSITFEETTSVDSERTTDINHDHSSTAISKSSSGIMYGGINSLPPKPQHNSVLLNYKLNDPVSSVSSDMVKILHHQQQQQQQQQQTNTNNVEGENSKEENKQHDTQSIEMYSEKSISLDMDEKTQAQTNLSNILRENLQDMRRKIKQSDRKSISQLSAHLNATYIGKNNTATAHKKNFPIPFDEDDDDDDKPQDRDTPPTSSPSSPHDDTEINLNDFQEQLFDWDGRKKWEIFILTHQHWCTPRYTAFAFVILFLFISIIPLTLNLVMENYRTSPWKVTCGQKTPLEYMLMGVVILMFVSVFSVTLVLVRKQSKEMFLKRHLIVVGSCWIIGILCIVFYAFFTHGDQMLQMSILMTSVAPWYGEVIDPLWCYYRFTRRRARIFETYNLLDFFQDVLFFDQFTSKRKNKISKRQHINYNSIKLSSRNNNIDNLNHRDVDTVTQSVTNARKKNDDFENTNNSADDRRQQVHTNSRDIYNQETSSNDNNNDENSNNGSNDDVEDLEDIDIEDAQIAMLLERKKILYAHTPLTLKSGSRIVKFALESLNYFLIENHSMTEEEKVLIERRVNFIIRVCQFRKVVMSSKYHQSLNSDHVRYRLDIGHLYLLWQLYFLPFDDDDDDTQQQRQKYKSHNGEKESAGEQSETHHSTIMMDLNDDDDDNDDMIYVVFPLGPLVLSTIQHLRNIYSEKLEDISPKNLEILSDEMLRLVEHNFSILNRDVFPQWKNTFHFYKLANYLAEYQN